MTYRCERIERKAQPTLFVRTRADVEGLSELMGKCYGEIARYLGQVGAQPAGPPFAAYYNMDLQDLDVAIGFPVPEGIEGEGEIDSGEIPAGSYAMCFHVGPYSAIESAYQALTKWMEEKGLKMAGASYEFYLNDPQSTPPEDLRTQILFTVE
jgi:effector-binding domain-containing protein